MQLVHHRLTIWAGPRELKNFNQLRDEACRLCVIGHLDLLLACAGCVKDLD
jgi:hypothetical protein